MAFCSIGSGYLLIAMTKDLYVIFTALFVAGVGFGLNQPNCVNWLLNVTESGARSRATASLTFATCAAQLTSAFIYDEIVNQVGSTSTFAITSAICFVIASVVFMAYRSE
jgi:hypothetical protein